ncbi:MAG: pyridoxal-phosphate dependent enzyme [Xanthomonadales bacterium]|nr:pyridoxal-phosphate dependent enzyme [Xanthomonadales bacterium]
MHPQTLPDLAAIRAAAERIASHARRTPVLTARSLDELAGCRLYFKCENLQRAGAFKFRGASNAVWSLDPASAARGVVTQSSGNHGAAVALACRERGIAATVVVPANAPKVKLAAIAAFGARIVPCQVAQSDRDRVTAQVLAEHGGSLVHPFDDGRVIAGQGTATLELLEQVPEIDTLITPVSGGGLLSGACLAGHGLRPGLRLFGAEPRGASDAHDGLRAGTRITGRTADTVCDGLRAELGRLTFPVLHDHLEDVLLVDDDDTVAAMRLVFERLKLVVEPSAAIVLAAVLGAHGRFAGRHVGLILSGGNVDLDRLPWQHG